MAPAPAPALTAVSAILGANFAGIRRHSRPDLRGAVVRRGWQRSQGWCGPHLIVTGSDGAAYGGGVDGEDGGAEPGAGERRAGLDTEHAGLVGDGQSEVIDLDGDGAHVRGSRCRRGT